MANCSQSVEATINNLSQTITSLQHQLASITQSKFNVPTFDVASFLFDDFVCVVPPKHMEIPELELYNRKGDPLTHVNTFQTLCSDFLMIKDLWPICLLGPLQINNFNGIVLCLLILSLIFNNFLMISFKNFKITLVLRLL